MSQKVANMAPTCAQAGLSLGVSSAILDSFGTVLFSITVFTEFLVPGGPQNEGPAAEAANLWGHGKSTVFHINWEKPMGKRYFGKVRFSSPVRRGELLRGEVSQRSTSPLKSTALRFEEES